LNAIRTRGRRKYFRIARKTVLEVAVSPHSYGVRAFCSEDAPRARTDEMAQDMKQLSEELNTLEDKRRELRGMLDKIESREMEIKQIAASAARSCGQDQLESEILVALLSGRSKASDLAQRLEVPEIVVEDRLKRLKERGAVQMMDQEWSI